MYVTWQMHMQHEYKILVGKYSKGRKFCSKGMKLMYLSLNLIAFLVKCFLATALRKCKKRVINKIFKRAYLACEIYLMVTE